MSFFLRVKTSPVGALTKYVSPYFIEYKIIPCDMSLLITTLVPGQRMLASPNIGFLSLVVTEACTLKPERRSFIFGRLRVAGSRGLGRRIEVK